MPRRGHKKQRPVVALDPEGLTAWMKRYLLWLRTKNYSERTVENREKYLGFLIAWCEARSVLRPQDVTKPILERYQRHLYHLRKADGKPLSFRAQHSRLIPVRGYFKWLTRQNVLLSNPASELELPRLEHRLPKHVLSVDEAERVLAQPDLREPLGVRDRAILETLYSTGIRRVEVIGLSLYALDAERGTLLIRQGKGKKDRMVPIGERAIRWLEKYLYEVRPELVVGPDEGTLFLTNVGESFTPNRLTQLVRHYIDAAELGKRGSCHLFRHTMATLMLEHGADIRYIQEMLGHVDLSTTQIYTQVSIRKLKQVHNATHPGARLQRREQAEREAAGARPDIPSLVASSGAQPANCGGDASDTLHAMLDAEARSEAALLDDGWQP
jgi:integrase/recombinase XerD